MYTYQRRSDNRQTLKLNQSRSNISHSQCSREGSSRKKFIEVYSKKPNEAHTQIKANLRSSTVSLPVQFEEPPARNNFTHHLARSQVTIQPTQFSYQRPVSANNYNNGLIRSQSVQQPKTIIIKQTILRPTIVSFTQLPGNTPVQKSSYRQSFPSNILQNKNEILQAERSRQAAAPIKMLSNNTNQIHDFSDIQKIIVQPIHHYQPIQVPHLVKQAPFFIENLNPTIRISSSNPFGDIGSKGLIDQRSISQKKQNLGESSQKQKEILSNKLYIECEVNLEKSWRSKVVEQEKKEEQKRETIDDESYNSLKIIKQDREETMKQNLELGRPGCKCEKALNAKENEVKVNRRQTLQPKKNFIFV